MARQTVPHTTYTMFRVHKMAADCRQTPVPAVAAISELNGAESASKRCLGHESCSAGRQVKLNTAQQQQQPVALHPCNYNSCNLFWQVYHRPHSSPYERDARQGCSNLTTDLPAKYWIKSACFTLSYLPSPSPPSPSPPLPPNPGCVIAQRQSKCTRRWLCAYYKRVYTMVPHLGAYQIA